MTENVIGQIALHGTYVSTKKTKKIQGSSTAVQQYLR